MLPDAVSILAGLVWLRDAGEVTREPLDAETLDGHQRLLGTMAAELAHAHATGEYAKLASPRACGDCGYRSRCWGRPHQLSLLG